jgi:hypothetical protein
VSALLQIIFIAIGTSSASAQAPRSAPKQTTVGAVEKPVDANGQPPVKPTSVGQTTPPAVSPPNGSGDQAVRTTDQPKGQSIWTPGILGAFVSTLAFIGSVYFFLRNRKLSRDIADRAVTFEAQKLLVEINKQFIADPSLFAIYDDNPKNKEALALDKKLKAKVEALGYLKLNVFEIVFAELPVGPREVAWTNYFLDSLDRCSVLAEELEISRAIYHTKLTAAYDKWKKKKAERAKALSESKPACLETSSKDPLKVEIVTAPIEVEIVKVP